MDGVLGFDGTLFPRVCSHVTGPGGSIEKSVIKYNSVMSSSPRIFVAVCVIIVGTKEA